MKTLISRILLRRSSTKRLRARSRTDIQIDLAKLIRVLFRKRSHTVTSNQLVSESFSLHEYSIGSVDQSNFLIGQWNHVTLFTPKAWKKPNKIVVPACQPVPQRDRTAAGMHMQRSPEENVVDDQKRDLRVQFWHTAVLRLPNRFYWTASLVMI